MKLVASHTFCIRS